MESKKWWESRTIRFNALMLVIEAIALALTMQEALLITPFWAAVLTFIHGVGNIALRLDTSAVIQNSPADKSKDDGPTKGTWVN